MRHLVVRLNPCQGLWFEGEGGTPERGFLERIAGTLRSIGRHEGSMTGVGGCERAKPSSVAQKWKHWNRSGWALRLIYKGGVRCREENIAHAGNVQFWSCGVLLVFVS